MKKKFSISIMGFSYTVSLLPVVTDEDGVELSGHMDSSTRQIEISVKANPTPDLQEQTLLHEIIHICLNNSGLSEAMGEKLEEATTVALEHGLHLLYKIQSGII